MSCSGTLFGDGAGFGALVSLLVTCTRRIALWVGKAAGNVIAITKFIILVSHNKTRLKEGIVSETFFFVEKPRK